MARTKVDSYASYLSDGLIQPNQIDVEALYRAMQAQILAEHIDDEIINAEVVEEAHAIEDVHSEVQGSAPPTFTFRDPPLDDLHNQLINPDHEDDLKNKMDKILLGVMQGDLLEEGPPPKKTRTPRLPRCL